MEDDWYPFHACLVGFFLLGVLAWLVDDELVLALTFTCVCAMGVAERKGWM